MSAPSSAGLLYDYSVGTLVKGVRPSQATRGSYSSRTRRSFWVLPPYPQPPQETPHITGAMSSLSGLNLMLSEYSADEWGDFTRNTELISPNPPLDATLEVTHCQQGESERQEAAVAMRTGSAAVFLG